VCLEVRRLAERSVSISLTNAATSPWRIKVIGWSSMPRASGSVSTSAGTMP
jgi:hypothetical protein